MRNYDDWLLSGAERQEEERGETCTQCGCDVTEADACYERLPEGEHCEYVCASCRTPRAKPEPPAGPFYDCAPCHRYRAADPTHPCLHSPDTLRFIKGQWQCWPCFYGNYADGSPDVQAAWDEALTLAQVLMTPAPQESGFRPPPHSATLFGSRCPDGGHCHHECQHHLGTEVPCWRMKFAASLTVFDASGSWPFASNARKIDQRNREAQAQA